jgi:hypothetical protein
MSDKTQKARFYWAIVGDANPEPVAVTTENGQRVAYTIGCADPFPLDVPEPNIELVESGAMYGGGRWEQSAIRLTPPEKIRAADLVKRREAAERRLTADEKRGIRHGWQRWNP